MLINELKKMKHRAFELKRDSTRVARVGINYFSPRGIKVRLRVRRGIKLPILPQDFNVTGGFWAVSMVKNAEDIIEDSVMNMFRQGARAVVVADNMSTDHTREILEKIALEHPLLIADDFEPAYFQSEKMTQLARFAMRNGATWIVPFDADELWFAEHQLLNEKLNLIQSPIAVARIYNAFPVIGVDDQWQLDSQPSHFQKVAFRSSRMARLHYGNHGVDRVGASSVCLLLAHFPWRNFKQFSQKVREGAQAVRHTGTKDGEHWLELDKLSDDQLLKTWRDMLNGVASPKLMWAPSPFLTPVNPKEWITWGERAN